MKKRSEVLKKKSAAERTIPLFEETKLFKPEGEVFCDACDETAPVSELTKRADGKFECPHCGAPVEMKVAKKSTPSPEPVDDEEEDEDEEESESAEDTPPPKKKGESTWQSGVFCAECGTQWAKVNGSIFPNCGHKNKGVKDPSEAKRILPAAGHRMPDVKRVRIVYNEAMFRVADYSTFRTPLVELEAEVRDGENYQEIQKSLYAEAKKMADEAFNEIYESYMQKLGFIREDLKTRK